LLGAGTKNLPLHLKVYDATGTLTNDVGFEFLQNEQGYPVDETITVVSGTGTNSYNYKLIELLQNNI
jgi:hypothetical protein